MSGLALAFCWDGSPADASLVLAMADAAPYRGPDGVTVWAAESGNAAIASQASHVTPESEFERQPFVDRAAGVVYAAYARLDDREALLANLNRELHQLRASSRPVDDDAPVTDVELIAAAHRRWGDDAPSRLVGDFAYVSFDPAKQRVFAARDAMGMRPLYYRLEPGRVLIATEVAQVLAAPGVPTDLDVVSLAGHLLQEYFDNTRTAYSGVSALPPAHALTVSPVGSAVRRVWDYDMRRNVRFANDDEYAEALRETFAAAVKDRMRSSHVVAANLSGGMDSGATVATAAWLAERGDLRRARLRTYSWAFEDLKEADERHISDLLVQRYGLDAANVPADDAWPLSAYPELVQPVDDPFTVVYTDLLDVMAGMAHRDGARSLMTSARGDLVVGDAVQDQLGLLISGRFRDLATDLRFYAGWRGVGMAGAIRRLLVRQAVAEVTTHPWAHLVRRRLRRRPRRPVLDAPSQAPWVTDGAVSTVVGRLGELPVSRRNAFTRAPRRERRKIIDLPGARKMLEWDERFHARHGLEVTDPWSDRRVAELALAMPQWMVQRHGERKRVARHAMEGIMPEAMRTAVRKIDPSPLFRRALEDREVQTITELLTNMQAAEMGLVDERKLRNHYDDVRNHTADLPGLWPALTLEMWLRAHHGRA